ncbi:hypothetical protein [Nocardia sp. X0981]
MAAPAGLPFSNHHRLIDPADVAWIAANAARDPAAAFLTDVQEVFTVTAIFFLDGVQEERW